MPAAQCCRTMRKNKLRGTAAGPDLPAFFLIQPDVLRARRSGILPLRICFGGGVFGMLPESHSHDT